MQLVLQLTRDCNFGCTYCYQAHRKGPGMTAEVAERAVRFVLGEPKFAPRNGHLAVTWFGGEPLIERGTIEAALPRLLRAGRDRGALVTTKISTNGALLDEAFCRFAKQHALFVSLSTDGSPKSQDAGRPLAGGGATSELVERALAALVATRTPFATYSVVHPGNVRWLRQSVDWLFERGARILISTLDFGAEWRPEHLRALDRGYAALARRYIEWSRRGVDVYLAPFDGKIGARTQRRELGGAGCAAGIRQIAVDPEGFVYPCIEFLESPDWRIGHIDRGLDPDALGRWRATAHGGGRPDACSGCGIRERCASTCACLNLRTSGAVQGVSALLCEHERLVTLAADRIAARLWRGRNRTFLRRQYDPHHHVLSAIESLLEEARQP